MLGHLAGSVLNKHRCLVCGSLSNRPDLVASLARGELEGRIEAEDLFES